MKMTTQQDVVRIENKFLEVSVSLLGAELMSIINKKRGRELLWQGNPEIWENRAPILFPTIGSMKSDTYLHEGKKYHMPLHGFAHESRFELDPSSSDTSVCLVLTDTPETFERYPFRFRFAVRFTLEGSTLIKEFTIENRSEDTMYYELGGHDGYSLNLFDQARMSDFEIRLGNPDSVQMRTFSCNGLINRNRKPLPLEAGRMKLEMELFANGMVLENVSDQPVELWHGEEKILTVRCPGFPYVGVWTAYLPFDPLFICIEPWLSLPDGNFLGWELEQKIGIRALGPGKTESCAYYIDMA